MKHFWALLLFLFVSFGSSYAQSFERYFHEKTMRFDFVHAGNATNEHFYFQTLREEPYWAGSKVSLLDEFKYGTQFFQLVDEASGQIIYSRGYCTLFNEWQSTKEAHKTDKAFPKAVIFPFPKAKTRIEFFSRNKAGAWKPKFQYNIDPESYFIQQFNPQYETIDIQVNGDPARKVDIILLGDGYTIEEYEKFVEACQFFAEALTSYSPFRELDTLFNFRAVWTPSAESGAAIPPQGFFPSTALSASFSTFDSDRYLMVEDFQRVRDIAAHAPYDYIYILSNTQKYGGGGIYNFYGISAADHPSLTAAIYVHEFGHLFMGLGDEYAYDSSYSDMYRPDVEPWEENLTTLTNFESKSIWMSLLNAGTPIPTPVKSENKDVIGVYEGAGYVAKGIYRPWINCLMRELNGTTFCPVCEEALRQYIYTICK